MDWPDHGAPETFDIILCLLKLARKIQPLDDTPLLVHCRLVRYSTLRLLIQTLNKYVWTTMLYIQRGLPKEKEKKKKIKFKV